MKKAQIGVEANGPEKRARFTAAARAGICLNGPAESRPDVGHHPREFKQLGRQVLATKSLRSARSRPGREAAKRTLDGEDRSGIIQGRGKRVARNYFPSGGKRGREIRIRHLSVEANGRGSTIGV